MKLNRVKRLLGLIKSKEDTNKKQSPVTKLDARAVTELLGLNDKLNFSKYSGNKSIVVF